MFYGVNAKDSPIGEFCGTIYKEKYMMMEENIKEEKDHFKDTVLATQ
jgi:hypothetical protein